jgi:hypothetical protein
VRRPTHGDARLTWVPGTGGSPHSLDELARVYWPIITINLLRLARKSACVKTPSGRFPNPLQRLLLQIGKARGSPPITIAQSQTSCLRLMAAILQNSIIHTQFEIRGTKPRVNCLTPETFVELLRFRFTLAKGVSRPNV